MFRTAAHEPTKAGVRLRVIAGRRPLAADALLTVGVYAVLTLGVTSRAEAQHSQGVLIGAVLNVLLVGPLVVRRRTPLTALALTVAAAVAVAVTFGPTGGEAATLIALTTVASRHGGSLRASLAVLTVGVAVVAVGLALNPDNLMGVLAAAALAVATAVAFGIAAHARRGQMAALADHAARLERQRAQEAQLAVAIERARISREMHDVVAHNVSVMVALADGAEQSYDDDPVQATEAVSQIATVGREALAQMRGVLREPGWDGACRGPQPGIDGLDALIKRMHGAGLRTRIRVSGERISVSPLLELAVFRIVQEALTNVLRHATDVTNADVALRWTPDAVELEVTDDGKPADRWMGARGRGITGMRERALLHGASLTAGPRASGGWQVVTRLPLEADSGESRQ